MRCKATGLGPRDAAKKLSQNVARRVIGARCFLGHRDTQTHRHRYGRVYFFDLGQQTLRPRFAVARDACISAG